MEDIRVSGPDDEVQRWKDEAEELGIPQSRYGRERIRAGNMLWETGEFQADRLTQLLGDDGTTGESATPASSQTTIEDSLREKVLRELPVKGARDAVELSDLRQLVFGTKEEQREAILDSLEELNKQGKAERTVKGGFVQTKDE
ncbi:hypothetical protein [Salinibaculum salinum]|uniref:hypothetical protein n=1 Tax=Salinibaculum salinum TaxID=3131996 RepID=UPI0030EDFC4B